MSFTTLTISIFLTGRTGAALGLLGVLYISILMRKRLRFFDLVLAFVAILCLLPILLPIILVLLVTGEGYVFYKQKRVGINKKIFFIYKFATMLKDSPNLSGGIITTKNDPRITPFGGFLRKTKINELPQLLNILFGQMSVVGPRPHPLKLNQKFSKKIDKFSKRHQFKPGITGLAQISGFRGKIYNFYDMSSRVKLDRYYFKKWSLMLDLNICFRTIFGIIKFNLK